MGSHSEYTIRVPAVRLSGYKDKYGARMLVHVSEAWCVETLSVESQRGRCSPQACIDKSKKVSRAHEPV